MPWRSTCLLVVTLLFQAGCGRTGDAERGPNMDEIAEGYVKLVLAVGQHDGDYVDAYYGPEAWAEDAVREASALPTLAEQAGRLLRELRAHRPAADAAEIVKLRHLYLEGQLAAVEARIAMLSGRHFSFDEESKRLYDAVAPTLSDEHFQGILDELEGLLPGEGSLEQRYEAYRREFVIPGDRLDAVFREAIRECRDRTRQHLDLPAKESFEIGYVNDEPWSAYNWYRGDYRSLIQVNTDLDIHIDRAIDLACHEGYPGHHAYNVLLERHLGQGRGWVEFTVYPLFSPQSLIAEGTANFGIEVAFPGAERAEFEREALFPLAGLDPARAEHYYAVQQQIEGLSYAGNEAARRYLDGRIGADEAARHLQRFALMSRARAEQRVRFIDRYRSYVINYNLGQDLVRRYVEARGGTPEASDRRWAVFGELISSPRLPSGLE